MEITLEPMTRELCRRLFSGWQNDSAIYADISLFRPYVYDEAAVDRYFDSKQVPSRVLLAIMLAGEPIGEVQLKRIDREKGECNLSIHMKNDGFKGRGFGTEAERLAVDYAFSTLGLCAVNADTVKKNTRSAHVLEKVGFKRIGEDEGFFYYRLEK